MIRMRTVSEQQETVIFTHSSSRADSFGETLTYEPLERIGRVTS